MGPTCDQLKLTWGHAGPTLGHLWPNFARLGPTWAHMEPSWCVLGLSWADLGASLGHPGTILAPTFAMLKPSWAPVWHFRVDNGPTSSQLRTTWARLVQLGPFWCHFGRIFKPFWISFAGRVIKSIVSCAVLADCFDSCIQTAIYTALLRLPCRLKEFGTKSFQLSELNQKVLVSASL